MAGITSKAETVLSACAAAGVVFRRPCEGRLRPILTQGEPPRELLERVRESREPIALHLEGLFAAVDELRDDAVAECAERGGLCRGADDCPWVHECRVKGAKDANKR